MRVTCEKCGKDYRNEAPILVPIVNAEGKRTFGAPEDKDAYWFPNCKCHPLAGRVVEE